MPAEIESLTTDRPNRSSARSASPMTAVVAVLGLLLAAYAHLRLGQVADRDTRLREQVVELAGAQGRLDTQIAALGGRLDVSAAGWRNGITPLEALPAQVGELGRSVEELRARTEAPQRAWIGAEAAYLLELAGRRITLERDVATAIVAMESADARLATLKDPAIGAVREQLARELAALRAVPIPDVAALLARLASVESAVPTLPVLGIPVSKGQREAAPTEPSGSSGRARQRIASATRDLLSLRRVDPAATRLVTLEEESLRRQHLQLLLLSARIALMQRDTVAFRDTLVAAERWLARNFDATTAEFAEVAAALRSLATATIDVKTPQIGAAASLLQRSTRGATAK